MSARTAYQLDPVYTTMLPYAGYEDILSPAACAFLCRLHETFSSPVNDLLRARAVRQAEFDAGELPDFLPQTRHIRDAGWSIDPVPRDLEDRRVEITGPPDRKMVINALNSGASVFMADFEDAHSPTWLGTLEGQRNLYDAVRRTIEYTAPDGKRYRLVDKVATLVVRPRGWHLLEKHFLVRGSLIPGALFDFGLYLFHNARYLVEQGSGPYFYLPKLENYREARLWNDIFLFARDALDLPRGTIKATVLIETLPAAFEMDEILFELREHVTGLNCGRWDYIFSTIKCLRAHSDRVLPERAQVTMTTHFLRSYSQLLIKTCHRRGAYAIGGMAAQIPVRDDAVANERAFDKVRQDKEREAGDGHDGTWVAHPGLVPVAKAIFDRHMRGPNQLHRTRQDVSVSASDLLRVPEGTITEAGVRDNVGAALRYIAWWLAGKGAVPINNVMEDAATAEIARAQLWQWIHHPEGVLDDGRRVTRGLFCALLKEELAAATATPVDGGPSDEEYGAAAELLRDIVQYGRFEEFLTVSAYERLP